MPERLAIILPAAGASTRFGQGRNKLLEPLAGQTVLARSARAFLSRKDVAAVIIATGDDKAVRDGLRDVADDPRIHLVPGGASRAESVRAALSHVPANIEWIAVHDAARPLVSAALIDRVLQAAKDHGAAAPALPVSLTIKQAIGPLPAVVEKTVPRANLYAMQTPQIAGREAFTEAFKRCSLPLNQITDDLQLLELAGYSVWLVDGEERNLKITTQIDLEVAKLILVGSNVG